MRDVFRYAAVPWDGAGIDGMNEMGAKGWEAIGVHDGLILYKRTSRRPDPVLVKVVPPDVAVTAR